MIGGKAFRELHIQFTTGQHLGGKHDEIVDAIKTRYDGVSDTVYVNQVPGIDPQVPADLIDEIKKIPVAFEKFRDRFND